MTQTVQVDQEVATKLAVEGGTLVLLNVPPGTEFGIDTNVYQVGHKFRGIKMIPPGIHFICYSAVSREGQTAPRTGFYYAFKARDVLVKKWDRIAEDFSDELVDREEYQRICQNLHGEMDQFLGPYPYESWKKWIGLTDCITEPLLNRLEPSCKKIQSVTQFVPQQFFSKGKKQSTSPSNTPSEDKRLPDMKIVPGTEIRFTAIPSKRYPDGCSPAEITHHSLDSSYLLQQMLRSCSKPEDILGELQMAFVCFLVGNVYDAFEQWERLVHILCTSDDALDTNQELYAKLISVLHFQVKEVPKDFFVDIVSDSNFLTSTLQVFFSNLETSQACAELKKRGKKFKASLIKLLKWDFDSPPDDWEPVVVDLTSATCL